MNSFLEKLQRTVQIDTKISGKYRYLLNLFIQSTYPPTLLFPRFMYLYLTYFVKQMHTFLRKSKVRSCKEMLYCSMICHRRQISIPIIQKSGDPL